MISGNTGHGIMIDGDANAATTNNTIQGNTIGLNAAASAAIGNLNDGIRIHNGANNTTIGGSSTAARNLIGGNSSDGIEISNASSNRVLGNRIGTNLAGSVAIVNNGAGIAITTGSTANSIGTDLDGNNDALEGNLIVAGTSGVRIAHWSPRPDWKGSQAFYDDYLKRFGEDPDFLNSELAWMSLEILETAVKRSGLDKEKMRQIIASETFETINGPVRFDGVQNAITPTAFVQYQKGRLQLIWPKSIATGQYEAKKGW